MAAHIAAAQNKQRLCTAEKLRHLGNSQPRKKKGSFLETQKKGPLQDGRRRVLLLALIYEAELVADG